jgi:DNA primase
VGIPDEEVAQVRAATDIVALIGEHAALKKVGRRWTGLCPFHTEKTPVVQRERGRGVLLLLRLPGVGRRHHVRAPKEHLDFVDAVRLLADRAGMVLHEDPEVGKDRKRRTDLLDALERAVDWYHERLLTAPDAGRPATTCARAATTATWCASSAWAGRPTTGTP